MNEKPIIFNGEMVRAILDGRKTQTRRVVKPQPWDSVNHCVIKPDGRLGTYEDRASGRVHILEGSDGKPCPYGAPGDRLWVRETWAVHHSFDDTKPSEIDGLGKILLWLRADASQDGWEARGQWRPSSQMPRWASRITLTVKDVRVERLKDIGEADAIAEGVEPKGLDHVVGTRYRFGQLWNSINYTRGFGWDVNPWVWVIEFEVEPGATGEE